MPQTHAEKPQPITVVNLMTSAYSGATWLCMLLGSHPEMFAVGEIDCLVKRARKACSVHGEDCPLWSQIEKRDDPQLYFDIARTSGKRILVVNKARKLLAAQNHPLIQQRFLFMPRDGRAPVASRLRKDPDATTWEACRWWARSIRKKERIVRRYPRQHTLDLRYEQVVREQDTKIPEICAFLGLDFNPSMMNWAADDHHFVGGNNSVRTTLQRVRGDEKEETKRDSHGARKRAAAKAYYTQQDHTRFKDERWRSELTVRQQRLFALLAGRTNRRYGYPSGWPDTTPIASL